VRKIPLGFLLSTAAIVQLSLATAYAQTTTAPPATAPAAPSNPPPPSDAPAAPLIESPPAPPSAAVPTPELPAPAAVSAPQPPARRSPVVTLLATSQETVLQEKDEGRDWLTVCRGRCERRQDPAGVYRVGGRGLYPSQTFMLPRDAEQVEIKARMGSKVSRVAGTIIGIGGLASLALNGFVYAVVGDDADSSGKKFDKGPLVVGMIIGGLGAVIGLLMATTSSTSVEVRDHLSPPAPVE